MHQYRRNDLAAAIAGLTLHANNSIANKSSPIAIGARVSWLRLAVGVCFAGGPQHGNGGANSHVGRHLGIIQVTGNAAGDKQCGNAKSPHRTPPVQSGICVTLNPEYPA